MTGTHTGQKRASGHLKLETQAIVNHHMNAGNRTQVPCKNGKHSEPLSQLSGPTSSFLKFVFHYQIKIAGVDCFGLGCVPWIPLDQTESWMWTKWCNSTHCVTKPRLWSLPPGNQKRESQVIKWSNWQACLMGAERRATRQEGKQVLCESQQDEGLWADTGCSD